MTTYKTSELEGALLDAAVARADGRGLTFDIVDGVCVVDGDPYRPSTEWSLAGPILEREHIGISGPDLSFSGDNKTWTWWACHGSQAALREGWGRTPLVAICRAFVLAKLGETVELP